MWWVIFFTVALACSDLTNYDTAGFLPMHLQSLDEGVVLIMGLRCDCPILDIIGGKRETSD